MKVLITGSAGAIGRLCVKELAGPGYHLRGLDLHPSPGVDEEFIGDIDDPDLVDRAVAGVEAVIHLAAAPNDADFLQTLLRPNIVGLYLICDAARRHGVKRLVLTSSMQAVGGHIQQGEPLRIEQGPRPRNHYALTKVFAEQMGEMYARMYNMSVVAARVGFMARNATEAKRLGASPYGPFFYLSGRDCARFYRLAIESPRPPAGQCAILFAFSRSPGQPLYDLETSRQIIGYVPQDTWPEGAPTE